MKKSFVLIALFVVMILGTVACGREEVGRDEETEVNNNVIGKKDVSYIQARVGENYIQGWNLEIYGDYKVLCDIDTPTDIEDFVSKFDNWTREGNEAYFNFVEHADHLVYYFLKDNLVITCSTEVSTLSDGRSGYLGSINNNQYFMPEELGYYSKQLYDDNYFKASFMSESGLCLIDEKRGEFLDFVKFEAGYSKSDCANSGYGMVSLGEGYKPGMSLDELSFILADNAQYITYDTTTYYSFYDAAHIYERVNPGDDCYMFNRVWCFYSGDELVGVTYFKISFDIEGYEIVGDYASDMMNQYFEAHKDDPDFMRSDIYWENDKVITKRPSPQNGGMAIEVYYYNLESLEKKVYSGMACNYSADDVSYYYFTNEEIQSEYYWKYRPEDLTESLLICSGKKLSSY